MFGSNARQERAYRIQRFEETAARTKKEAAEYRKETKEGARGTLTGPYPDPEWLRLWNKQREPNQKILDANARDTAKWAAEAKKRWWQ